MAFIQKNKLCIKGFSENKKNGEVMEFCEQFGSVVNMYRPYTIKSIAYLTYKDEKSAGAAMVKFRNEGVYCVFPKSKTFRSERYSNEVNKKPGNKQSEPQWISLKQSNVVEEEFVKHFSNEIHIKKPSLGKNEKLLAVEFNRVGSTIVFVSENRKIKLSDQLIRIQAIGDSYMQLPAYLPEVNELCLIGEFDVTAEKYEWNRCRFVGEVLNEVTGQTEVILHLIDWWRTHRVYAKQSHLRQMPTECVKMPVLTFPGALIPEVSDINSPTNLEIWETMAQYRMLKCCVGYSDETNYYSVQVKG